MNGVKPFTNEHLALAPAWLCQEWQETLNSL